MKTARDLMTDSVCRVNKSETVDKAFGLLKEHNFHHLLVMENKKIIGVVSTFDLLYAQKSQKIEEVMTQVAFVAVENETVKRILNVMIQKRVNALPIVNLDRELQGIITSYDIMKYLDGILKVL